MTTTEISFENLVSEAINCPDLESGVRGLFVYANNLAGEEDKENFTDWFKDEQLRGKGLMDINTLSTRPEDYFEACEGVNWNDLAEYYNDRY